MKIRSWALRAAAAVLMLGALYWWSYQEGIVTSFTQRMGWADPGPLLWDMPDWTSGTSTGPQPLPSPEVPASPDAASALLTAAAIPVATTMATGYERDLFTSGWTDIDGCDTRNRILARDLTDVTYPGGETCRVATGTLADPYTGASISFVRGPSTSSAVQIDHVVSLAAAWRLGANTWTPQRREAFANDPTNLLAVDGPTNARKSDKTLAEFAGLSTPAGPVLADAFECQFTIRYVTITASYELAWTSEDAAYAADLLPTC